MTFRNHIRKLLAENGLDEAGIEPVMDKLVASEPGKEFGTISRRWAEKMDATKYQRPVAAPADGAIAAAVKLFEQMGAPESLKRRFAGMHEVQVKLWIPKVPAAPAGEKKGGVFDHLKTQKDKVNPVTLPSTRMTWAKFQSTVMPEAESMEVHVPSCSSRFYGLVTAENYDAPAILQWDGISNCPRNPVSWYYYTVAKRCERWNLVSGWAKVTAIFHDPAHWYCPEQFKHHPLHAFFAIEGCRDIDHTLGRSGLALFPEIMKSELHGVRSVIEAHSRSGVLADFDGEQANGIAFNTHAREDLMVRVKSAAGVATYILDRWD